MCVCVCLCLLCMYAYGGTKSDGELGKSRGESTATPVSLMPRVVLWSMDHRFSGGVQRCCSVYEPQRRQCRVIRRGFWQIIYVFHSHHLTSLSLINFSKPNEWTKMKQKCLFLKEEKQELNLDTHWIGWLQFLVLLLTTQQWRLLGIHYFLSIWLIFSNNKFF